MRMILVVITVTLFSGCSAVKEVAYHAESSVSCPSELNYLALDAIYGKFPQYNYLDVWLSHNYDQAYWKPRLADEQKTIDGLNEWANKQDRCLRIAYLHWTAYYQGELDSAWQELRSHATEKEMDAYDRDNQTETDKTQRYRESHSIPKPPLK